MFIYTFYMYIIYNFFSEIICKLEISHSFVLKYFCVKFPKKKRILLYNHSTLLKTKKSNIPAIYYHLFHSPY